jgi:hypothetical protein
LLNSVDINGEWEGRAQRCYHRGCQAVRWKWQAKRRCAIWQRVHQTTAGSRFAKGAEEDGHAVEQGRTGVRGRDGSRSIGRNGVQQIFSSEGSSMQRIFPWQGSGMHIAPDAAR